jgi:hypothetical protein
MPVRDDITREHIPASAKRYARMSGPSGINGNDKLNLYNQMQADLVHTSVKAPFRPRNVARTPGGKRLEASVGKFVQDLLAG